MLCSVRTRSEKVCNAMMLSDAMPTFHMLAPCIILTKPSYALKFFQNGVRNAQCLRLGLTTAACQ